MAITEKYDGCRFFEPSYDFFQREVNNPVVCDRTGDCTKCGWNPIVDYERKKNFDITKRRIKSVDEDGADLFGKPDENPEVMKGLFE